LGAASGSLLLLFFASASKRNRKKTTVAFEISSSNRLPFGTVSTSPDMLDVFKWWHGCHNRERKAKKRRTDALIELGGSNAVKERIKGLD
jgi:hypothetical protein